MRTSSRAKPCEPPSELEAGEFVVILYGHIRRTTAVLFHFNVINELSLVGRTVLLEYRQ